MTDREAIEQITLCTQQDGYTRAEKLRNIEGVLEEHRVEHIAMCEECRKTFLNSDFGKQRRCCSVVCYHRFRRRGIREKTWF